MVVGVENSTPAPGVLDAIAGADVVVLPPSNPSSRSAPSSPCPACATPCAPAPGRVVGLSPIVGERHVRGMAEQMLTSIGVEVSAAGVGLNYGARERGGVLDGWLIDERDAGLLPRITDAGLACAAVPLMMTDHGRHRRDGRRGDRPGAPLMVSPPSPHPEIVVRAPDGIGEIEAGCDLAAVLVEALVRAYGDDALRDGDVLVVTSKVVSKAEGRVVEGDREAWVDAETVRPVGAARAHPHRAQPAGAHHGRRRGRRLQRGRRVGGAAAPRPRRLGAGPARAGARAGRRHRRRRRHRHAGRAWREGQTDIAIGAAASRCSPPSPAPRRPRQRAGRDRTGGGRRDRLGRRAGPGQARSRPCGILRGRADLVLPLEDDGPGAGALIRPEGGDLFGWGAGRPSSARWPPRPRTSHRSARRCRPRTSSTPSAARPGRGAAPRRRRRRRRRRRGRRRRPCRRRARGRLRARLDLRGRRGGLRNPTPARHYVDSGLGIT